MPENDSMLEKGGLQKWKDPIKGLRQLFGKTPKGSIPSEVPGLSEEAPIVSDPEQAQLPEQKLENSQPQPGIDVNPPNDLLQESTDMVTQGQNAGQENPKLTPATDIPTQFSEGKTWREGVYAAIPELNVDDITDKCGFDLPTFQAEENFFCYYVAKALANPGWMFEAPLYSDENKLRAQIGLPRAQQISKYSAKELKKYIVGKDERQLYEVAKKINDHSILRELELDGGATADIFVRTLELMSVDFPNLRMYRGCSFMPGQGYIGIDFAPGDLLKAWKGYGNQGFMGKRENPIIAMLSFKDLCDQYTTGGLQVRTEHNWWGGSVEVRGDGTGIAVLRRFPGLYESDEEITEEYKKRAIKMEDLPDIAKEGLDLHSANKKTIVDKTPTPARVLTSEEKISVIRKQLEMYWNNRHRKLDKEKQQIWDQMSVVYQEDARNILDLCSQNQPVVINGPHGSGKTGLLLPELKKLAEQDGTQFVYFPTKSSDIKGVIESLASTNPSRIICVIDEFVPGDAINGPTDYARNKMQEVLNFLSSFDKAPISPIFINPCSTKAVRKENTELISSMADKPIIAYELKRLTVPADLAASYLSSLGVQQDLIDFFTNPENESFLSPAIFGDLRLGKESKYNKEIYSLEDLRKHIDYISMANGKNGGISTAHLARAFMNLGIIPFDEELLAVDSEEKARALYKKTEKEAIRLGNEGLKKLPKYLSARLTFLDYPNKYFD